MLFVNFRRRLLFYTPKLFYANMSSKCEVAVCQFTATNDKERNLSIVKKLVNEAVDKNAKVVFLPEATDYIGTSKEETKQLSEPLNGKLMSEYKNLAKSNNIWLSIGGIHEKVSENETFNSHVLIDNKGEIQSLYRKIHLFDVCIPEKNINLRESDFNKGGNQVLAPASTPCGKLGLAICYDLRFPELALIQRKFGAEILTYPSAFTSKTGQAHWEILLRARAIENQCYVIAAAQYGKHNEKRVSYGQSIIIDPWGKILSQCPVYKEGTDTNESVAVATIDLEHLAKMRNEMPVMDHKRNDVYSMELNETPVYLINDDEIFSFADKTIPGSTVFYKTPYSFAFTNIRCVVPGHVLISSLRPAKRLQDLTETEIADLFNAAVKVEKVLEKHHSTSSTTVCVQDGRLAGQTVPHVHVHILPRHAGDFERNDDIYDSLAKHDLEDNPQPLRTPQEMSEEAKVLRTYF
ncbi:unnamed protein product [Brassicogethes aeneus]|uniref:Nitrilase and fragile histidine triad fusion protein NitFhit n=1 Tax=Brassicogethes aeneus TaxID=1431903 RepID=A0A9P0FGN0_BRAAE|nr:unnamed protein product [Brassicogethes aeneus]